MRLNLGPRSIPSEALVARFLNNIALVASATAPIFANRRRVNVCALARRSDNGSGAVPPQPFGPMGLRPNSLSLVVADAKTATPPRFAISARKPHRRLLCSLGNEPLGFLFQKQLIDAEPSSAPRCQKKENETKQYRQLTPILHWPESVRSMPHEVGNGHLP